MEENLKYVDIYFVENNIWRFVRVNDRMSYYSMGL